VYIYSENVFTNTAGIATNGGSSQSFRPFINVGGENSGNSLGIVPRTGALYTTANPAIPPPRLSYKVQFIVAGTYNVYVRMRSTNNNRNNNEYVIGLDGDTSGGTLKPPNTGNVPTNVFQWHTGTGSVGSIVVPAPDTVHTVDFWALDDGFYVDAFLLYIGGRSTAQLNAYNVVQPNMQLQRCELPIVWSMNPQSFDTIGGSVSGDMITLAGIHFGSPELCPTGLVEEKVSVCFVFLCFFSLWCNHAFGHPL
jgi:hypothetical protein